MAATGNMKSTGPTGPAGEISNAQAHGVTQGRTDAAGSATPVADTKKDLLDYPFLVKTIITFTKNNEQGIETKHKDEVVFKLDAASARMPWYVLRNYSVPKFLTQKYGPFEVAWQRIYEIKIIKLINRKDPTDITEIPLRVMTLQQLEEYCGKWELNVPVTEFYSVEKAREMVALRQQDEEGYKKHLAEYRDGKQRQYPELDNMRGDKEAATAEVNEFTELEKQVPDVPAPKKVEPSAVISDHPIDPEIPGTGDQPGAVTLKDPFAGV